MTSVLAIMFWIWTPKLKTKKRAKTNTWDFISLKSFCKAKETINKVKKNQPTKWEKILANHVSDEALIFKICKEFIQPKSQKRKQVFQV